jgi:hypothetical protein
VGRLWGENTVACLRYYLCNYKEEDIDDHVTCMREMRGAYYTKLQSKKLKGTDQLGELDANGWILKKYCERMWTGFD